MNVFEKNLDEFLSLKGIIYLIIFVTLILVLSEILRGLWIFLKYILNVYIIYETSVKRKLSNRSAVKGYKSLSHL